MSTATQNSDRDDELLRVLRESQDPVMTAVEVGETLGITQQAAHARLSQAHERGNVTRKNVGARAVVWWIPS